MPTVPLTTNWVCVSLELLRRLGSKDGFSEDLVDFDAVFVSVFLASSHETYALWLLPSRAPLGLRVRIT